MVAQKLADHFLAGRRLFEAVIQVAETERHAPGRVILVVGRRLAVDIDRLAEIVQNLRACAKSAVGSPAVEVRRLDIESHPRSRSVTNFERLENRPSAWGLPIEPVYAASTVHSLCALATRGVRWPTVVRRTRGQVSMPGRCLAELRGLLRWLSSRWRGRRCYRSYSRRVSSVHVRGADECPRRGCCESRSASPQ